MRIDVMSVLDVLMVMVTFSGWSSAVEEQTTTEQLYRFVTPCETPNNEPAYCRELQLCPILYNQILENNNESFEFINNSRCGPPNEDPQRPKVCCGTFPDYRHKISTVPPPQFVLTTTATTPKTPTLQPVLPKKCGKQRPILNNRIFGGIEADLGEFPWMVRLRHKNKFNYTSYGCSGFLIHKRFVLTAAHCLQAKALEPLGPVIGVLFGAHNDNEDSECATRDNVTVCSDTPFTIAADETIIHRNYEPSQHLHDIALVHLKQKIRFTEFVTPICLPSYSTSQVEFWLSGWGKTETGMSSTKKLKVSVPRVDTPTCADQYRTLRMTVHDTQLCAGGLEGRDSCAGDSGGPLMALDRNNTWFAEGIVSYGSGCGRQNWPGVYTNIPKYIHWIIETINSRTRVRNRNRMG